MMARIAKTKNAPSFPFKLNMTSLLLLLNLKTM